MGGKNLPVPLFSLKPTKHYVMVLMRNYGFLRQGYVCTKQSRRSLKSPIPCIICSDSILSLNHQCVKMFGISTGITFRSSWHYTGSSYGKADTRNKNRTSVDIVLICKTVNEEGKKGKQVRLMMKRG